MAKKSKFKTIHTIKPAGNASSENPLLIGFEQTEKVNKRGEYFSSTNVYKSPEDFVQQATDIMKSVIQQEMIDDGKITEMKVTIIMEY